jgi:hypothetical protein
MPPPFEKRPPFLNGKRGNDGTAFDLLQPTQMPSDSISPVMWTVSVRPGAVFTFRSAKLQCTGFNSWPRESLGKGCGRGGRNRHQ